MCVFAGFWVLKFQELVAIGCISTHDARQMKFFMWLVSGFGSCRKPGPGEEWPCCGCSSTPVVAVTYNGRVKWSQTPGR